MAKDNRSYSRKLLDPRWQKNRLEILSRDNFTCQECFATDKPLHVHHLEYERGIEPWEYPDNCLITLCEDCHLDVKTWRPKFEDKIIQTLRYRLKDKFLFHCFSEFLEQTMYVPEFALLFWKADQNKLMEFLLSHVDEELRSEVALTNSEDMKECNACGSKKIEDFKRYQYLKCTVCGYSIRYGKNPNDKTEAR